MERSVLLVRRSWNSKLLRTRNKVTVVIKPPRSVEGIKANEKKLKLLREGWNAASHGAGAKIKKAGN